MASLSEGISLSEEPSNVILIVGRVTKLRERGLLIDVVLIIIIIIIVVVVIVIVVIVIGVF